MDHHIGCVARVLNRLSKTHDLRTWCLEIGTLQGAIIDEGFIHRVVHQLCEPNSVGLEGLFYRATFDNGRKEMAVVCYDKNLHKPDADEPKRRFIVAKELSHIFDEPGERTTLASSINEHVSGLMNAKVLPRPSVRADNNARLLAIEMLIPYERRMLLMGQVITSATVEKLAQDCGVPPTYAATSLDGAYMASVERLRKKAGVKDLY